MHALEASIDGVTYRKLGDTGVERLTLDGEEFVRVSSAALRDLTRAAFDNVFHLLRPAHLQ